MHQAVQAEAEVVVQGLMQLCYERLEAVVVVVAAQVDSFDLPVKAQVAEVVPLHLSGPLHVQAVVEVKVLIWRQVVGEKEVMAEVYLAS